MTIHVTQLVDTAKNLKDTVFETKDEWVVALLLAKLPDRFAPMIMVYSISRLDAIKTNLMDMCASWKKRLLWEDQNS